jgi:FecR protein
MQPRKWTPILLLMISAAMQSSGANAQSRIGIATSTRPDAQGIVGTDSQTLSPGSELFANEMVRTGNRGQADLVLLDSSNLFVGSTSEVLLDKFVYDRTGSSGSVVLQATSGTFRFATGSQDLRAYQVNTPYGSIGAGESLVKVANDIIAPPTPGTHLSFAEENDSRGTTAGSGGGTTVEVVVKPKGQKQDLCPNGRPRGPENPCQVACEAVVRLVKGTGASFTSTKGTRADLKNENDVVCITPTGAIVHSTSSESILPTALAQLTTNPASPTPNAPNGGTTTPSCQHSVSPSRLCP